MQGLPQLGPAAQQLVAELSLRRLPVILLQCGVLCQRVEKIPVKADSRPFVYKFVKLPFISYAVRAYETEKRHQQVAAKQHGARVKVNAALMVDGADSPEPFLALLMQKLPHIIVPVVQIDAVILSHLHPLLNGNSRGPLGYRIDLQRVKQ